MYCKVIPLLILTFALYILATGQLGSSTVQVAVYVYVRLPAEEEFDCDGKLFGDNFGTRAKE